MDLQSLNSYDYALPPELIAQRPAEPRDESRLLVIDRKSGKFTHRKFKDLPEYLDANDLMVANNTQVFRARLAGQRILDPGTMGGKVEMLLLEEISPGVWEGAFHAAARHKVGLRFLVPTPDGQGLIGEIVKGSYESKGGTIQAKFSRDPIATGAGEIPLPHYIDRATDAQDLSQYQTLYAKNLGSAAAPTAGLHFTPAVMAKLKEKNIAWREVTLHVGLGTFRPVKTENIRDHVMHEERYEISEALAQEITAHKHEGKRILAVGTTSVRTLESAWENHHLQPGPGRTSIFIYPGGRPFHVVDRLLTNFHLPKSTLLMLVCAFAGRDLMMAAYEEAVREKYRFFSYGDAMLVC